MAHGSVDNAWHFIDGKWIAGEPKITKIVISVVQTEMPDPTKSASCTLSKWRRPSPETAPTDAKAVCLYAQAGRASAEAKAKGFDEAVGRYWRRLHLRHTAERRDALEALREFGVRAL